jgi:hypothetical protein
VSGERGCDSCWVHNAFTVLMRRRVGPMAKWVAALIEGFTI